MEKLSAHKAAAPNKVQLSSEMGNAPNSTRESLLSRATVGASDVVKLSARRSAHSNLDAIILDDRRRGPPPETDLMPAKSRSMHSFMTDTKPGKSADMSSAPPASL